MPSFSARAAAFKANPPPAPPSTDMEYTRDVPMRDGRLSEIRIYQPDNSTTAVRPLFVLVHGGGFCVGNNHAPGFRSRLIAAANDMTVVNVSYRLAPEHPFPAAPDDVWDAVAWLSQPDNAKQLGADPTRGFYIGGISAGGNLAAVTAQRWVADQRTPALRGLWLYVPVLLDEEIVPAAYRALFFSRAQNAAALVIDRAADDYVRAAYAPDVTSPLYSPFNAARPHEGMPRVHLQVAGQDPVRDDGLIYEKALRAARRRDEARRLSRPAARVRRRLPAAQGLGQGQARHAPGDRLADGEDGRRAAVYTADRGVACCRALWPASLGGGTSRKLEPGA
ncbi:alpha/beta hydrolase fold-3 domain-containing protein [Verticillium alfalfae VaMs.102]|uniref:Alpha/beta hydrolase fold-3 domain-containing protein n=1 Tax=Verticillium alfalfae (strain VaMs.102 / ATCC MYA-4576 / FGSC 10136) TaxID=526221 RepID=C9SVK1_VERA1|nr:alpha/beta hydrolase fold-3 domain-containing protein [Verticillium alfalfae VaMs.102]EEY22816.1 alpha/beta hydrolase fold-3 domain-containing protein [Verticillium alfalfae VaMs.102]